MSLKQILVKNATAMSLHERWEYFLFWSILIKLMFAHLIHLFLPLDRTVDVIRYYKVFIFLSKTDFSESCTIIKINQFGDNCNSDVSIEIDL